MGKWGSRRDSRESSEVTALHYALEGISSAVSLSGHDSPVGPGAGAPVTTPVFAMRKRKLPGGPSRGTPWSAEQGFKSRLQKVSANPCTALPSPCRCLGAAGEEGEGQRFPAAPTAPTSLCPLPLTDSHHGQGQMGVGRGGGGGEDASHRASADRWGPGPTAGLQATRLHRTMEKWPSPLAASRAPAAGRGKGL